MKPVFLKMLYVGSLWEGTTTLQRMKVIQELGHNVQSIDIATDYVREKRIKFLICVWQRLFGPLDLANVNVSIVQAVQKQVFDVVWIDNGFTVRPGSLRTIKRNCPNCKIVGYSPDDITGNKHNQSRRFLASLPYYDIYFTTKTYCVSELEALGCPRVEFIGNAYDKHTHRAVIVTSEDRKCYGGPVGFIGQWEPQRAKSLCFLADSGINVRVWGYTWERCKQHPKKLLLENKPLWAEDYARAICSFDINLCFLRKANRDLQTTRSIEIPACGGFMLAERTDEHLELFEKGKEAEFFDCDEELLDKVRYYLEHDEERKRIAHAGRQRCLKSGYSNHDRLREAIDKVMSLSKLK